MALAASRGHENIVSQLNANEEVITKERVHDTDHASQLCVCVCVSVCVCVYLSV